MTPRSVMPGSPEYHTASALLNRYVGRSFIQPSRSQREEAVKVKPNVVRSVVGKRVVLIDDSIVGADQREDYQTAQGIGDRYTCSFRRHRSGFRATIPA